MAYNRRLAWVLAFGSVGLACALLAVARKRSASFRQPGEQAPARTQSAVIDGVRMRWEHHGAELGSGVPVVFVHGLPTNPRAWRYVIPHLEHEGSPLLAWEQVGFGWSLREGFGRDLSIPAQADHLRAWLRHLGIERAVFVAHDYGGGVVQALATRAPDLFQGLVLSDSVAFDNWPVLAVRTARAMNRLVERLPHFATKALFRTALANLGHTNAAVAAESMRIFWHPYAEGPGPAALAHQLRHFDEKDTLEVGERLRPLGCPTIVVWGERDPLGLWSARRLARSLGGELIVIPGAHHFTIEDHPSIVADAVRRTLRSAAAADREDAE